MRIILSLFIVITLISCTNDDGAGGTYVKPSIDYKGKFRKGHVRKPVSTDKNAINNRTRSKYYYETRGKYRKRNK
ncbi:MAG: hypothetical protein FGM46_07515 [Ferruginibacter sp.]|nr:hypothetical protein [Ferruginibacter sp.]